MGKASKSFLAGSVTVWQTSGVIHVGHHALAHLEHKRHGATVQCLAHNFVLVCHRSFHYWRIHPAYWEDRLRRGLSLGLNTIQVHSVVRTLYSCQETQPQVSDKQPSTFSRPMPQPSYRAR